MQARSPEAKLYFLAGADKLGLIRLLEERHGFLARFGVALVSRQGIDPMDVIRRDGLLRGHEEAFLPVPQPEGLAAVSSTAVRTDFLSGRGELGRQFLPGPVWTLFSQLDPADYPPEIERFQGEYEFLSNRYSARMEYEGLAYCNAEAAFQAARCQRAADRRRFLTCDGARAKAIAAGVPPRDDWAAVRLAVMEGVLREKFRQHPELTRKLIGTGRAVLVNGNHGTDRFWGVELYTSVGENWLGRLLMKLRSEYQAEEPDVERR